MNCDLKSFWLSGQAWVDHGDRAAPAGGRHVGQAPSHQPGSPRAYCSLSAEPTRRGGEAGGTARRADPDACLFQVESTFFPALASSCPRMTSPSARCAFFKIVLLSSSFLLMVIHA